ncbi:Dihydroorotase [Streptomyces microflavus]
MVRGMEITAEVADSDRCTVVEQVANGVSIRMAVLYLLLGGSDTALSAPARPEGPARAESPAPYRGDQVTMSKILIRGARILGGEPQDVLIDGETVAEVGTGIEAPDATTVIEAAGQILLPGLVDLHTHLREPGREDSETVLTGTRAAAAGGFTAVHAMANTFPVADTAGVVEQVWRLGKESGYCDVQPIGAVTVGLEGKKLAELGAMHDSAAGVKVFSDDGKCVDDAVIMRRALEDESLVNPDGVFFSNGPGDPSTADHPVALMQGVLERSTPLFGICFGNQILGRALGFGYVTS